MAIFFGWTLINRPRSDNKRVPLISSGGSGPFFRVDSDIICKHLNLRRRDCGWTKRDLREQRSLLVLRRRRRRRSHGRGRGRDRVVVRPSPDSRFLPVCRRLPPSIKRDARRVIIYSRGHMRVLVMQQRRGQDASPPRDRRRSGGGRRETRGGLNVL